MGNCSLCGKKLGMFDKRKDVFDKQEFNLCEECGWEIDHVKRASNNGDYKEFCLKKNDLKKSIDKCTNPILKNALIVWVESLEGSANVDGRYNNKTCPICASKIEKNTNICSNCNYNIRKSYLSKDNKMKIASERKNQYPMNPMYEYAVEVIKDSEFVGNLDKGELEFKIMKYALEGWKLHTLFVKELGKNKALVVNATIEETYLVFERKIKS